MPGGAKKSLGQNYLVNNSVALRIVEALRPEPGELVFEIGSGKGALTAHLARSGAMTVSLEIDRELCAELSGRFAGTDNVEILNADVRELDFDRETRKRGRTSCKIIGNIPYMLTSSILIKIPDSVSALCSVIKSQIHHRQVLLMYLLFSMFVLKILIQIQELYHLYRDHEYHL